MLISVERLLIRVRHVPSRAAELIELRRRLREERAVTPSDAERAVALTIRELKQRVSTRLSAVTSCTTCAIGKRSPRGTFPGGDCCSAVTADLFSDDEVAALAQAGTRPTHLDAPRTAHAGCSFRGALGCTLEAAHRPGRCVHYTCTLLRGELRMRGELVEVDQLLAELKREMLRFVELRNLRIDDEILAPLEALAQGPSQR